MSIASRRRRGFTLIEALVATTLLAVGIVGTMTALGSIAKAEAQARERETMQRLAYQKYDEVVATSTDLAQPQNGDFQDRGDNRYVWRSEVEPSGVENLDAVTVTVELANSQGTNAPEAKVYGLVYVPPTTTATGGTQ